MDELFKNLPVEFVVKNRPPGDTVYLFSWSNEINKGYSFIINIIIKSVISVDLV